MAHAYLKMRDSVEVRQQCSKVPHPDRKTARSVAARTKSRPDLVKCGGSSRPKAYKCSICGAWHVGHAGK